MDCKRQTDNEYIKEYINNWKKGGQMNCSNVKSGLLDFIKALIINKNDPSLLVQNWCLSCAKLKLHPLGYITISGAFSKSVGERPIYYFRNDEDPKYQLTKYNFNPETEKWSDKNWLNVVVRQPDTDIYIDPSLNIRIRTIPVGKYYYLFVVNPACGDLPMPVYQYVGDFSSISTNPLNINWPLVGADGSSLNTTLNKCPANCDDWKWN